MSENMCKAEKHEFVWEKYFNKPFEIPLATCSYHSIKLKQTVLVTKVSGPDEIEIGQSATYTIDSYNVDNVSDEDKKRVKWKIQVFDNIEETNPIDLVEPVKNNSNYIILNDKLIINNIPEKWCNSNIRVHPYMVKATSAVMSTTYIKFSLNLMLTKYSNKNDNDLNYGDKSIEDYYAIDPSIKYLDWGDIKTVSDDYLFSLMTLMCTSLFSTGAMEKNIISMINRFKINTDSSYIYTNTQLTNEAKEHERSKKFVKKIKESINKELSSNNGRICSIQIKSLKRNRPVFHNWGDILGGLTIAINDVSGYKVELVKYKLLNIHNNLYTAKIRVTLIDHFGLDDPDLEKKYRYLNGFRAWYILQHIRGYIPFKVHMQWEEEWISNF